MKCPNCGNEVGNETVICQFCGKMITKKPRVLYCKKCGYPGQEGDKFCINCGSPMGENRKPPMPENINTEQGIPKEDTVFATKEKDGATPRKTNYAAIFLAIGGGALFLAVLIGGIFFYRSWKAKVRAREEAMQYQALYDGIEKRFDNYIMTKEDEKDLKAYQKKLSGAIEDLDIETCARVKKGLADFEKEAKEYSIDTLDALRETIEEADDAELYEVEREEIDSFEQQAEKLSDSGKYKEAQKIYGECQEIIDAVMDASYYGMDLRQVDVTNFPEVNLYLSIRDLATDEALDDLKPKKFSIQEKVQDGSYKELDVKKAVQLDKEEGLNTAVVADVSASMGSDLLLAEDAMANFVQGMQYNVNDKAALYSFADTVYREQHFTGKQDVLEKAIYNMEMGNMTALYDALVYAISDIVVEQGAKCVIAFTDGQENNSNSTKSYVIEKAQQYDVPVYIIGIGYSVDSYDLQDIAQQTGGFYKNINDIGSMESVYDEIYQAQKSMYLLQYRTQMKSKEKLMRELYIRYSDDDYTVRTETSYIPATYKIEGYVFYDSDSRYLKEKELSNLSEEEVLIALNEIYARRGYLFQTNLFLIDHFNQCSWYHGKYKDQNKVSKKFNKYERENVKMLVKYEKKHKLNNRK